MLQTLSIRDFVIVDQLELNFERGYTVLTGETGAGKSILIDALSLALGARNEGDVVRHGCDKAEMSANFTLNDNHEAQKWLSENEMQADDNELVLRRVIYADGRSRAFINGTAATIAQLKELGEFLVDIYSQNAHHSLLKLATQRAVLDDFGGLSPLAQDVSSHYKNWAKLNEMRLEMTRNASKYADELAELRDKTRELAQLDFDQDEWESLQQEHSRLSHGASLLSGCEASREILSEGDISALRQLGVVQAKLQTLRDFDASLDEPLALIDSAMIGLEEADRFINRYLQKSELDPARLAEVESRIQAVHSAARKYRVSVEMLPATLMHWQARMAELDGVGEDGELEKNEAAALAQYMAQAQKLSAGRLKAAKSLSTKITQEMQRLSLAGGQFEVLLTPHEKSASGLEQVEFLVAGHAGVALKPLNKAASGGELSRISLAIRVVTAQQGGVPTMIFDEVDVGIGGGVAEIVGQLLKQLGFARQVLVITHLPQVAALGKQHLRVSKTQTNGQTLSHIEPLDDAHRIEEIARMLGGIAITDTTRQHAKEMLTL
ncbi:MAG TPA: DNA repair protein RecN [Methylotenera sp.]|nr:DNA repair protein RecN [Methylotenera sp.]HPH05091.1 DNA repair protein RecN [Methylotenera sp.]HPN00455.1 DNA repair protein RecN [Methylotenera sp.]